MGDLLGPRVEEHVAVRGLGGRLVPGLEEVLEADAHLAFLSADGLLEGLGEERARLVDLDLILELVIVVEHGVAKSGETGVPTLRSRLPRE